MNLNSFGKEIKSMEAKEQVMDKTPPQNARASISNGVTWTTSTIIKLNISAADDVGVAGYFVSENPTIPTIKSYGWVDVGPAPSYSGEIEFTLSHKDGTKTIYVWFRDDAWNVSEPAKVSILITSYALLAKWGREGKGEAEFIVPAAIAIDPSGYFYIVDPDAHRVQKFDRDFNFVTQWGGLGGGEGKFDYPRGVEVDSEGNIYVVDSGNHCVQKFNTKGEFITQWGKEGSDDGEFYYPYGIGIDHEGNIWIVDSGNHRLQRFDKQGKFLARFGKNGNLDGMLLYPRGVTVDASGNLYVTDSGNHRIQKFDGEGRFLKKWGRKATAADEIGYLNVKPKKLSKPDDGEFILPWGITRDSQGKIYVADSNNHRIQIFDGDGNFITKFGLKGSSDGEFDTPYAVLIDPTGQVYVLDSGNTRVQKFEYVPREEVKEDAYRV